MDNEGIKTYTSEDTGRTFYRIKDGVDIHILEAAHLFCPCEDYARKAIKDEILMCRHTLAVRLHKALKGPEQRIGEDEWSGYFMANKAYLKHYSERAC